VKENDLGLIGAIPSHHVIAGGGEFNCGTPADEGSKQQHRDGALGCPKGKRKKREGIAADDGPSKSLCLERDRGERGEGSTKVQRE